MRIIVSNFEGASTGVDHQRPSLHARPIAGDKPTGADREGENTASGQPPLFIIETKRVRALRRPSFEPDKQDAATGMPPLINERPRIAPPATRIASQPHIMCETPSPHERQTQLLRAAEEQRMATMVEADRLIRTDHDPAGDAKGKGVPKRIRPAEPAPTVPVRDGPDSIVAARPTEIDVAACEAIAPRFETEVAPAERQSPARKSALTKRHILWRLSGFGLFAAAVCSSLIHRHVLSLTVNHAASAVEMGLGLTSFVLASLGVLLLMHGSELCDGWVPETNTRLKVRTGHRGSHPEDTEHMDPAIFGSGREALAALLAHRTQEHIARTSRPPARPH